MLRVSNKSRRQKAILELIGFEAISSQRELQVRLQKAGFQATQATISRDLKQLGVVKRTVDGAYQLASEQAANSQTAAEILQRAVDAFLLRSEQVQQIVVLGTGRGQAQPLAEAIDRAALPEVVGTLAGDDTILVVSRNAAGARSFVRRLDAFLKR